MINWLCWLYHRCPGHIGRMKRFTVQLPATVNGVPSTITMVALISICPCENGYSLRQEHIRVSV